jgi:hypothetical protein
MPAQWTLYKSATPQSSIQEAEYYELSIRPVPGTGPMKFQVIEMHGWWDDQTKQVIHHVDSLNPADGEDYLSFEQALQRIEHQKRYLARNGFVHSFSIEIPSGKTLYELIEP